MPHSGRFYIDSQITDKAQETFPQPVTQDNWDDWHAHWISVAETMRAAFEAEGLTNSAKYVVGCIEFNQRVHDAGKTKSVGLTVEIGKSYKSLAGPVFTIIGRTLCDSAFEGKSERTSDYPPMTTAFDEQGICRIHFNFSLKEEVTLERC